jgi:hypothetical protein
MSTCGRCLCPSSGECSASRQPKSPFQRVFRSDVMSFFFWDGTCSRWFITGDVLFLSLFSLIPSKITLAMQNFRNCSQIHGYCHLDLYSFYFYFLFFAGFVRFWFVFNLIIQSQFRIFFSIWSSFFFLIVPFVELIFIFNFTLQ